LIYNINCTCYYLTIPYGPIPDYSKDVWIDAAVDKTGDEIVMASHFTETDWYFFHQAAKAHLASAMDLIKELV